MKTVHKSVLIWYSPHEMYTLVTGVNEYPQFLPWCEQASVLDASENAMTAEIGIAFGGIRQTFTTRNEHEPDRKVRMQLVNGPFSRLDGEWDFTPVGNGDQRACRVTLTLNYGFSNAVLARLVGPVFDRIAGSLVDAFVQRAERVYG